MRPCPGASSRTAHPASVPSAVSRSTTACRPLDRLAAASGVERYQQHLAFESSDTGPIGARSRRRNLLDAARRWRPPPPPTAWQLPAAPPRVGADTDHGGADGRNDNGAGRSVAAERNGTGGQGSAVLCTVCPRLAAHALPFNAERRRPPRDGPPRGLRPVPTRPGRATLPRSANRELMRRVRADLCPGFDLPIEAGTAASRRAGADGMLSPMFRRNVFRYVKSPSS